MYFVIFFSVCRYKHLFGADQSLYKQMCGAQKHIWTALFLELRHVAVLDAEDDVGTGTAAGCLMKELTRLQR